jgi:glycosyltransferase involved in cell wall biosynthesis
MSAKVLHLIATLGSGGAERQVSLLLPNMKNMGLDFNLCFHTEGPNLASLHSCGIEMQRLPNRANHDPRLLLDIAKVVREIQPDIIQTWLPQMDVLGGLVAQWMGIAHVLSERSSAAMYAPGGWKNRLRVAIGRRAQAVIANSEGGLAYWRAHGARGHLHVVRNALTPPSQEPAPLSSLGLEGQRLLVAAGRLSHEKNVPVLVKAMEAALARLPNHHAVIFGDGPERESTQALIVGTGLSGRIHLGGYTAQLSGWLRAADVFVSASLVEGHPNVVIEAAAAGCPLVLSDIPAHREFAVDGSGLFAPASDPRRLADAMVLCVTDRTAALARAGQARRLTETLAVAAAAQRHIDIYRSLLNERTQS